MTTSEPIGEDAVTALWGDPAIAASVGARLAAGVALAGGTRVGSARADGRELIGRGIARLDGGSVAVRAVGPEPEAALRVIVSGAGALADLERITVLVAAAADVALATRSLPAASSASASSEASPLDAQHTADHDRLDGELAIGRRIQRSLMPRRFPSLPGWDIAAAYDAAREVGGDLYDAFLLRDRPDRLGFVVADVTGKGIPAALVMADVRALIHAAADHGGGPGVTLSRVNKILVAERATGLFVTVVHGEIDAATGNVDLANAGHEPVHIVHADGSIDILEPTGRLIGMVDDILCTSAHARIGPGDLLVAHTDGITEARSPDGRFYGEDRYRATLAAAAGRPADAVVDAVVADVTRFRDGAEASDDLTLLVVGRRPAGDATASGRSAVVDLGADDNVRVDVVSS